MSEGASAQPVLCVLGFDVGDKRIGTAVGNSLSQTARALDVLVRGNDAEWQRIDRLCQDWRPQALIVGDPLALDGTVQDATRRARRFARQLHARYRLPVVLVDERSSSKEADRRFAAQRAQGMARRRDGAGQDARAAQIIVERWLAAGMPLEPSHDIE